MEFYANNNYYTCYGYNIRLKDSLRECIKIYAILILCRGDLMFDEQGKEETIIKAQRGNSLAINYLINSNMDIVYAKSKNFFIKGLDRDDVIQEGMVGLFKAIRDFKFDGGASFRGFVQLCVHRQLVSAIKRANSQNHIPLNNSTSIDKSIDYNKNGQSFIDILPDGEEKLEEHYIYKELLRHIFKDLERKLTDLERNVFLQYLENRSYHEISHNLQINIKTVDNALQRARRKIKQIKRNYNAKDLVGQNGII
jgi:RNA polymerase sporulation-specific sigma factor